MLIYLGKITFAITPFPGFTYEIIPGGGLTLVLRRPYYIGSVFGIESESFEQIHVLPAQTYILYNVWCKMLRHPKLFIVSNPLSLTLLCHPPMGHLILVNISSRVWFDPLEDWNCMHLIPYMYNKKKHCWKLFSFLFNLPTYRNIWVLICCYSNLYMPYR